jgi:cell division protein FtsB
MFDFHEKRKIRGFLYSKGVIFAMFLLASLLSISVYNRYTVASEMQEKLYEKKTELEELKQRAGVLESKVKYLENERGVEEELRNRFDVARDGEQVIILLDPRNDSAEQGRVMSSNNELLPNTQSEKSFLDSLKFWQ